MLSTLLKLDIIRLLIEMKRKKEMIDEGGESILISETLQYLLALFEGLIMFLHTDHGLISGSG